MLPEPLGLAVFLVLVALVLASVWLTGHRLALRSRRARETATSISLRAGGGVLLGVREAGVSDPLRGRLLLLDLVGLQALERRLVGSDGAVSALPAGDCSGVLTLSVWDGPSTRLFGAAGLLPVSAAGVDSVLAALARSTSTLEVEIRHALREGVEVPEHVLLTGSAQQLLMRSFDPASASSRSVEEGL